MSRCMRRHRLVFSNYTDKHGIPERTQGSHLREASNVVGATSTSPRACQNHTSGTYSSHKRDVSSPWYFPHLFSDALGHLVPLSPFDVPAEKKLHAVSGLTSRDSLPAKPSRLVWLRPLASVPPDGGMLQGCPPLAVAGRLGGDGRKNRCGGAPCSSRLRRRRGEEKQCLDVVVGTPQKPRSPGQTCKLRGALTLIRVVPPPKGCRKSGDVSSCAASPWPSDGNIASPVLSPLPWVMLSAALISRVMLVASRPSFSPAPTFTAWSFVAPTDGVAADFPSAGRSRAACCRRGTAAAAAAAAHLFLRFCRSAPRRAALSTSARARPRSAPAQTAPNTDVHVEATVRSLLSPT